LESKALLSSDIFQTNPLNFLKIQTLVSTYSLIVGASKLAILVFFMGFLIFWHFLKLLEERFSHVTPAAKGLLTSTWQAE